MKPRVLVVAEHDGAALAAACGATVGAARALGAEEIAIAILGTATAGLANAAAAIGGVDRVLVVERPENWPCLAAVWAPQIAALAEDFSHLLAPATTFGKDLLPRIAGLLGVSALSDLCAIDDAWTVTRPVYAGNALETIAADPARKFCASVRPTAFAAPAHEGRARIVRLAPDVTLPAHTRFIGREAGRRAGPELGTAARVVAGGRGLGGAAGLALLERLALALDAAVGASRAAVDAGWVGNERQVGQTGRIIAPALYVAVGISGAIQHLTGIKDAGTIVAINRDAEAPLCKLADFVLIADLHAALPTLIEALESRRAAS